MEGDSLVAIVILGGVVAMTSMVVCYNVWEYLQTKNKEKSPSELEKK